MTIKHIVISGGGPTGITAYGALSELAKKEFWSLENIESIYATSAGSFIGVIIALGYDWSWIDDYLVKRPWEKVADVTPFTFVEAFHKKGIVGEKFIQDSISPLLTAKDLPADVTLAGLFNATNIDIHIYTTEMNGKRLTKVDMSHITHPDLLVTRAMAMSGALPFLFTPVCFDGKCYIDGGMINNFPLEDCFRDKQCDESEVIAIKNVWRGNEQVITPESTMVDFFITLIYRLRREIDLESKQRDIPNILKNPVNEEDGFDKWSSIIDNMDMRTAYIDRGVILATEFLAQSD